MIRNIWTIFKSDLSRVKHNRILAIILCGLVIVPSFYAWVNILASWDPYGNTKNMKVGVVNTDKGSEILNEDIHVGDDIIDELKDNDDLNWVFYDSKEKIIEDTKNGKLYASFVIPEDFSYKLCTLFDAKPVKPSLEYYLNEKLNAVAPKITDKCSEKLQNKINEKFVDRIVEKAFEKFNDNGEKLDDHYYQLMSLKNFLYEKNDQFPKYDSRLAELSSDTKKHVGRIDATVGDLRELQNVLKNNENFGNDLSGDMIKWKKHINIRNPLFMEQLKQAQSFTFDLNHFINELDEISDDVGDEIDDAVEMGTTTIPKLKGVLKEIGTHFEKVHNDLNKNFAQVAPATETAGNLVRKAGASLKEISPSDAKSIPEKLMQAKTNLVNAKGIIDKITPQFSKVIKQLEGIENEISEVTITPEMKSVVTEFSEEIDKLIFGISGMKKQYQDLSADIEKSINIIDNTISGFGKLSQLPDEEKLKQLPAIISSTKTALEESLLQIQSDFGQIKTAADSLEKVMGVSINFANSKMSKANSSLSDMDRIVSSLSDMDKKSMEDTVDDLDDLNRSTKNYIKQFRDDMDDYIVDDVDRYLIEGSKVIGDVSWTMAFLSERTNNMVDIMQDSKKYGTYLTEDIDEARDKFPTWETDLQDLVDSLHDIDDDVSLERIIQVMRNDKDVMSDYFSSPINLETTTLFPVVNYGNAMTPFYTTLCLWVGAVLLGALLKTTAENVDLPFRPHEEYIGKYLLFGFFAILQALIVSLGDIFILGLSVKNPLLFVSLSMYYSVVFTAIVYTCISLFRNVGKAIAVLLLVIQIGATGGVYPIQIVPPFFRFVYPFLPFTYGINGLREAMFGVQYESLQSDVLTLLIFLLIPLVLGILFKGKCDRTFDKYTEKLKSSNLMEV